MPADSRYPFRIEILGKQYEFRLARADMKAYGDCDSSTRVIRIRRGLCPQDEFLIGVHEVLHAEMWDLDEAAVQRISNTITAFAVAAGFIQKEQA